MPMVVSDYVAEFLANKGINHVFGYQGSAVAKVIDSLVNTGCIRFIQNYHEQASALAADGLARISGTVGVAVATSGPGATNLVTGIANAQMDSIPVLFITGQDYSHRIGKVVGRSNGFQDLDIVTLVKPITKYAVTVTDPNRIRYELEKAFHIAASGRPGATLLDLPIDIQFKEIVPEEQEGYVPPAAVEANPDATEKAIAMLRAARRPVILVGGGVRVAKAEQSLRRLAAMGVPVAATLNGLDVVEGALGFAGLYGRADANLAVREADVLLVLGSRLGFHHVGKTPADYTRAKVIHVDIDEGELGRGFEPALAVQADLKTFLDDLLAKLEGNPLPDYSGWRHIVDGWVSDIGDAVIVNKSGGVDPVSFLATLSQGVADDAIFTADVGQNQMWMAQAFKMRGQQRLLNSSGLGAMGYALPAAVGACFVGNGAQVVAVTGDGGLQMNLQELNLLGHLDLNIKCVVMNNNGPGMIRELQQKYYKKNYYGSSNEYYSCPDLQSLAKAFRIEYLRIDESVSIDEVISTVRRPGPSLIEVVLAVDTPLLNRYDQREILEARRIHD